jgi:hypothetical protein
MEIEELSITFTTKNLENKNTNIELIKDLHIISYILNLNPIETIIALNKDNKTIEVYYKGNIISFTELLQKYKPYGCVYFDKTRNGDDYKKQLINLDKNAFIYNRCF